MILTVLAVTCGLLRALPAGEARIPALLMAAGIGLSVQVSPLLGGGLLLLGAGLHSGRWPLVVMVGGLWGWGEALGAGSADTAQAAGAAMQVAALGGLCLLPHPSTLPRLGGLVNLALVLPLLMGHRPAWWPPMMLVGFATMALGALGSLQPGRGALLSTTGLALLLLGLPHADPVAAIAAVALGGVAAELAEEAGGTRAAGALAVSTLGGLPPLGMLAWASGLFDLHAAGLSLLPVLAWMVLAIGAARQLRARPADAPGEAPPPLLQVAMAGVIVATGIAVVFFLTGG